MALRFRGLDLPIEVVYCKGGGGKTAPVPDPAAQIKAEQQANQYNVMSPSGSINYSQDPTGRTTQTTTLSPSEQKQLDTSNQIAETMLTGAQKKIPGFSDTTFNYNDQGSKAADATFARQKARLDPEFAKANTTFEDKMANAGIPVGSEAYNDALRQHENDQNFALTDAARAAETEGTGLALSERQQNYNELAAALGGQQLNPVGAFGQPAAPVDVAGAYAQQNQANIANTQGRNSGKNALLGGLTNLGGSLVGSYLSDERTKDDVEQVGELPTGEGVYEYHYKWEDDQEPKHTGVMAQEVERNYPEAVKMGEDGYRRVNYRQLIAKAMAA